MINMIFWGAMNCIAHIIEFIIVFMILGFILLLPFLLKGGWLLGLLIYGFVGMSIFTFLGIVCDEGANIHEEFERRMKEREDNVK